MAGVHQLKKLAQSRNKKATWVEYMPKHWSSYTLIFSVASLLIFCFCFYDFKSSHTIPLRNPFRELGGALKAQVGDATILTLPRVSPAEEVVTTSDGGSSSEGLNEVEQATSVETPQNSSSSSHGTGKREKDQKDRKNKEATKGATNHPVEDDTFENPVAVDSKTMKQMDAVTAAGSWLTELEDKAQEAGKKAAAAAAAEALRVETCDFSKGRWVMDEKNYPIYKPHGCPFVDGGFRCVENGRPSNEFQKWRWQPSDCNLPKFDAKQMLERLRGSRMAFVGDSIGRNNWESMLCMLAEGVPNKTKIYEINGETISKHTGFLSFRFEDYDCTVEYYRAPYLVPQGRAAKGADPIVKTTLKLDEIDWSARKWRDADIIVFNTGHWWTWGKTIRSGNYFQQGQNVPLDMTVEDAFREGMKTVAGYLEEQVDASKSQVFFRSYAPVHFRGGTWDNGGKCNLETHPVINITQPYEDRTPNHMMLEAFGGNVKTPVTFFNVTYLTDLRPDGHSSIWQNVPPTPLNRQDCSHWCLPGVPDTWNEILFAHLLRNGKGKWAKRAKW